MGAHVHKLKNNQVTGKDLITISGDHVHKLPNGELTEPAEDTKIHTHVLPDNSTTPSGPILLGELKEEETGVEESEESEAE